MFEKTITGLNIYEKKDIFLLDRKEIEEKIDDLDAIDLYRKTRKEAEGMGNMTGYAYAYIDLRDGEIKTAWLGQNNFLHPFDDYYRLTLMSENTPAYEFDEFDMLDYDELIECSKWLKEEGNENKDWEDYTNEILKDYQDRYENCIFYYATEAEIDWEEINRELNRIYG